MNGKRWLPEHTDILRRMNAVGYTDGEIAATTGHAAITVFYRRTALGLTKVRRERKFPLKFKYNLQFSMVCEEHTICSSASARPKHGQE